MERDEVLERIREHLAAELEVDPARDRGRHPLQGGPRGRLAGPGRADRGARGHLRHPDPGRGGGQASSRSDRPPTTWPPMPTTPKAETGESLGDLLDQLPEDLARQAFTHASWVDHRAESYERLAFLGDVVLSLAVSTHLYPRFERYGAGRLTKVRAQAVSGASCAEVALDLGVPERLRRARARRRAGRSFDMLAASERVLASICEAVIGAAYLAFGIERVAPAVVAAFDEADRGRAREPGRLQVGAPGAPRPARRGRDLPDRRPRTGPPHERSFVAVAEVRRPRARPRARAGPRRAPSRRPPLARARRPEGEATDAPQVDLDEGLQVLPAPHQARLLARRGRGRRPERLGQVEHHRRRAVGAGRAEPAGRPRPDDEGRDLRRRPRHQGLERGRGRGGDRQRRRRRSRTPTSPRSRSCASSAATARASTASTAPAAASPTWSRCCPTPGSARRCTRWSPRAASRRSCSPSRATGGC